MGGSVAIVMGVGVSGQYPAFRAFQQLRNPIQEQSGLLSAAQMMGFAGPGIQIPLDEITRSVAREKQDVLDQQMLTALNRPMATIYESPLAVGFDHFA